MTGVAPDAGRGYHAAMSRLHLVSFIAIGVTLFASMVGAAIAIGVAIWSARRGKANHRA
jgi:hypothetical protein